MNAQIESPELTIRPILGLPKIAEGDDIAMFILEALNQMSLVLQDDDILVIASKIISKSEGRFVTLSAIEPSVEAKELATVTRKDARIVQIILNESRYVSRSAPNVLVTEHRLGFVAANAGLDYSNVGLGEDTVLLLPVDPDSSASKIRIVLEQSTNTKLGIIISDTHGRPFRLGNVGTAIGVSGVTAFLDLRGTYDMFGRQMRVSTMGIADMLASAAHLISGEGAEGLPVVLIRGLHYPDEDAKASDLYRPAEQDLYR